MSLNKKVLIITYYWPPSGGSGVQRWLKFVKYLPQHGWKPIVFTPENPAFAIRDESLMSDVPPEAEVLRFPIWEPYEIFLRLTRLLTKRKKTAKPTDLLTPKNTLLVEKIGTWVRGNFFIPDPKIFWVRPASRFLKKIITENGVLNIITTGPPHSMHLIGHRLKKEIPGINWIADFRDPWTQWGLLDSLMTGTLTRKIHRRLESKVLGKANSLITVTPYYVKQFEVLAKRNVTLLTNGYDEEDFLRIEYKRSEKFLIRFVGLVHEKLRVTSFMVALKEVVIEDKEIGNNLIMEFIGEVHQEFKEFVKNESVLNHITKFTGNIPHEQLLSTLGESSLLLLILAGYKGAEGYMPGKLFEYIATGLPILGIGPETGDAADLLQSTEAGVMIEDSDIDKIKKTLRAQYFRWKEFTAHPKPHSNVRNYSRKVLTERLVSLLR